MPQIQPVEVTVLPDLLVLNGFEGAASRQRRAWKGEGAKEMEEEAGEDCTQRKKKLKAGAYGEWS